MADTTIAADAPVRNHLEQIFLHLQLVQAGILVSADALRHQNCERDEDVAHMLVHCVNERLTVQMDRIVEILDQLQPLELDCAEPEASEIAPTACH